MLRSIRRRGWCAGAMSLAAIPWCLTACSTPRVAATASLRRLTADDFRAAGQRGVGFGLLSHGNRNDEDYDAVAALGAGHVRVFLDAERALDSTDYRVPPAQRQALREMLDSVKPRGVYVLPVLSFGADARGALWDSAALQASAVRLLGDLAWRLRHRDTVAGIDLVNEPVPPGPEYAIRQMQWLEFAQRAARAVRAADPVRVVIVQSAPDATGESFRNLRPIAVDNVVYSLHSYAPFEFTHQGVMPALGALVSYPGGAGGPGAKALAESLEPVADFASRYDVPIYVGEFSAPRWAPDGSAARYVSDSLAHFNANGWSWCYHEFRAWHGWDPEMASSNAGDRIRRADAPVARALRAGLRAGRAGVPASRPAQPV